MIGGIVGCVVKTSENSESFVKNCYNTVNISSSSSYVGGIAGLIQKDGIANKCYILDSIIVMNKTNRITEPYGNTSNNFTGRLMGHKQTDSDVTEVDELSSDKIPTVYDVMNKFNNGESTIWSNNNPNQPSLLE